MSSVVNVRYTLVQDDAFPRWGKDLLGKFKNASPWTSSGTSAGKKRAAQEPGKWLSRASGTVGRGDGAIRNGTEENETKRNGERDNKNEWSITRHPFDVGVSESFGRLRSASGGL